MMHQYIDPTCTDEYPNMVSVPVTKKLAKVAKPKATPKAPAKVAKAKVESTPAAPKAPSKAKVAKAKAPSAILTPDSARALSNAAKTKPSANYCETPSRIDNDPIGGLARGRNQLMTTIAAANGCKYYLRDKVAANVILVGEAKDAENTIRMYAVAQRAMFHVYCSQLKLQGESNMNAHNMPWGVSFVKGYCDGLDEVFAELVASKRQTTIELSARYPKTNEPKPTQPGIVEAVRLIGYRYGKAVSVEDFMPKQKSSKKVA